ncbi:MAG: hypothetical protein JW797_02475 [Bradymonadales bacterium]|nr:hypothetical protein [Bradymonadales bacterium]
MNEAYRVHVFLTGVDEEKARQLREVLGRYLKGAGPTILRQIMRRAHAGERVLVYESNSDQDAQAMAEDLMGHGATIEIEGLLPPEEPF